MPLLAMNRLLRHRRAGQTEALLVLEADRMQNALINAEQLT